MCLRVGRWLTNPTFVKRLFARLCSGPLVVVRAAAVGSLLRLLLAVELLPMPMTAGYRTPAPTYYIPHTGIQGARHDASSLLRAA
eukprot:scaffold127839_cov33-Tisochrysis_lutea.AAC.2